MKRNWLPWIFLSLFFSLDAVSSDEFPFTLTLEVLNPEQGGHAVVSLQDLMGPNAKEPKGSAFRGVLVAPVTSQEVIQGGKAVPFLKELSSRLKPDRVLMLGLVLDSSRAREKLHDALSLKGLNFPLALDAHSIQRKILKLRGPHEFVLLDSNGRMEDLKKDCDLSKTEAKDFAQTCRSKVLNFLGSDPSVEDPSS